MQVKVLGAARQRRMEYDENVRLVEETLQARETVCGVARRHGVAHSVGRRGLDELDEAFDSEVGERLDAVFSDAIDPDEARTPRV
ncbi:hypothetical protein [Bradyrhizobium sp. CCBAU 11386]|uniref:hypothetical protein n=1 Tax=Bradyrhizobium sp. CCBAU 11386 TaxID=1630837 RepID=UPI00230469CC|nr:hypothetical protein [Bradyrhizobium sp. CCBAU 11386]